MLPMAAHHTSGLVRCASLAGPTLTFFAAGGGPLGLNAGQQGGSFSCVRLRFANRTYTADVLVARLRGLVVARSA